MNIEKSFNEMGIAPGILEILSRMKFTSPTPIQEQSIPVALEGKDLIGIAQTGTGKTLAFGIPMIQAVLRTKAEGLVILPTRELALQVYEVFQNIAGPLGLRGALLIGGEAIGRQTRDLQRHPHIIIGTPGRILDHIERREGLLSHTTVLVLDEADRMLDMGFAPQLSKILTTLPRARQTMLFSATMPAEIVRIAQTHMRLPVRVEVAPSGSVLPEVTQELFFVSREAKPSLLLKLLGEYRGQILVFVRTKFGVTKITRGLRAQGHQAGELHSNRTLGQRREALNGFKTGKYRVLVATDIAARGIDVKNIELVVNYDLPSNAEDYVHRIGRTGRAGVRGHAIAFATPDQRGNVRGIERLMRIALPLSKLPELPNVPQVSQAVSFSPEKLTPFRGRNSRSPYSKPPRREFHGAERRIARRHR